MTENIRYYKIKALDSLELDVCNHLDWYLGVKNAETPSAMNLSASVDTLDIETSTDKLELVITENGMPDTDKVNALAVYEHLRELSPHQAASEKIWAFQCHQHRDYVIARWLKNVEYDPNATAKEKDATAKDVAKRFFLSGPRGVASDNALSRLWQMGRFANAVEPDRPEAFLDVMLQSQDIWKQSIERTSVFSSVGAIAAAYSVMREIDMSRRSDFRGWMQRLDKKAASVMLSALDRDDLKKIFEAEAKAVLAESDRV